MSPMYDVNKLPVDDLKGIDLSQDGVVYVKAPSFVRDGDLYLSCESDVFVADYYDEFGVDGDNIIEAVRDWASANGGYWEWVDPGCLMFVK